MCILTQTVTCGDSFWLEAAKFKSVHANDHAQKRQEAGKHLEVGEFVARKPTRVVPW